MGGGGSKNLAPPPATMHTRERRMSHIETNPPPQSESAWVTQERTPRDVQ